MLSRLVAGETMGQTDHPGRGLGLKARGHARLVVVYCIVLLLLAGFGAGRLRETIPGVAARIAAARQSAAMSQVTEAAFIEAIRTNAPVPRPNPMLPHKIDPYPVLAMRRHQEGAVVLKVLVLPNGQVGDVAIVRSSGFAQLDAAALTGVGGWYYVPAVRRHRPVPAWTLIRVRFALSD